jgi:hypothetical protein
MPKITAPTGRKTCVRSTAPKTAEGWVWKSAAIALTQKMSRKKSSESIVQPRKVARKVCCWDRVSRRKSVNTDIDGRIAGNKEWGIGKRKPVGRYAFCLYPCPVATLAEEK